MPRIETASESRDGFTLIETIVAFAIMSLSLTIAVRSVSVSLHNAQRAQVETEMRHIARMVLSEELPLRSGGTTETGQWGEHHTWRLTVEPVGPGVIQVVSLQISHETAPKMSSTFVTFEPAGRRR